MNTSGIIFIVTFIALLISPFVFMSTKAHYHFEYLKKINPSKYEKFHNFLDTSRGVFFNKHIGLLFPSFNRKRYKEKTQELVVLGNKVQLYRRLTNLSIVFILFYVVILIIFFRDFS